MADVLFFIDLIFTFRTAKLDILTGETIKDPEEIARNYFFSLGFLVDSCSCLPWSIFGSSDIFAFLDLFKVAKVFTIGTILSELNVKPSTKIVTIIFLNS